MSESSTPATPAGAPGDTTPGPSTPGPSTSGPGGAAAPVHRERMSPTAGVWAAAALVALLFGIAALKTGLIGGGVTFLIVLGLEGAFLVFTAPVVEVTGGMFIAGGARIPVSLIGEAEALDPQQWRQAIGPEIDARAFLCMRGWIKSGVRVPLQDPEDPTPYWLVASARPAQLVAALAAARRAA